MFHSPSYLFYRLFPHLRFCGDLRFETNRYTVVLNAIDTCEYYDIKNPSHEGGTFPFFVGT